jgi:hypothetical protein
MIPTTNIKAYVEKLARSHRVVYVKTVGDDWCESITRLSEDVELDPTENLIIALARAGLISKNEVVPLHVYYLREKSKR